MELPSEPVLRAFENRKFLNSPEGRIVRVLAEFIEPQHRLRKAGIMDTIVFFGSARVVPLKTARARLAAAKQSAAASPAELEMARCQVDMAKYYEDAAELARQLTRWGKKRSKTIAVCSGGGQGIMEATNRGARKAKGPSVGLNIRLPMEQQPNPYISQTLNFEFHYFFIRKFWFLYPAKALVAFPGGYGTLDEVMEVLTLLQTRKVKKEMVVVLYGEDHWRKLLDWDYLVRCGLIDSEDLRLFHFCNTVQEAFAVVSAGVERSLRKKVQKKKAVTPPNLILDV